MSRTIAQRTNGQGFPKAGEVIEMVGTHTLEASDRAILNTLYQHAHDSGRMTDPTAEWEIPLAELRRSSHESNDRLYDSLQRLRKVEVTLNYYTPEEEGKGREQRIFMSGLFDFFDISAHELAKRATLRFGLPKKLSELLEYSNRWGRIRSEVVFALTSKYAIALYEMIELRRNLDRCVEVFAVDRFRDLLGVPPGSYKLGPDFLRYVVQPAVLEVNGLSDMGVMIEPRRRHARAPIQEVAVSWWKKEGEEFRAAMQEIKEAKAGRMKRLKLKEAAKPNRDSLQLSLPGTAR
jgi:plasmid replication initiation protein